MTSGKPLRLIIRFALPMLAGAVFQQLYNVIDMLVVGNAVGSRALAAIGATSSTTFLAMSLAMGLTNGFTVVASRYFGAKDTVMLRKTLAASIYISFISIVILAIVGWFGAEPLMRLLNTPGDIRADAILYVKICIGLSAGMVLYNCASSMLKAVGDSRTPLFFLIFSSILNVLLDLLFVLAFGMGVAGVAIATVISQFISAAACMVYMYKHFDIFRLTKADFKISRDVLGALASILKIGLPMSLQSLLLSIGDMTITGVVNSAGTDVVAAYATGGRIMQFVMMFCMQIAMAFSVFAGQNIGAKQTERIKRAFRETTCIVALMSLCMTGIIFLFGDKFINLFISSNDTHINAIIPLARSMLRVYASFYIFLGAIWLYNFALRGMGDVLIPFISGFVELIMKVTLSIILFRFFGHMGIWFANPIGWVLGLVPSVIRFHSGGWMKLTEKTNRKIALKEA